MRTLLNRFQICGVILFICGALNINAQQDEKWVSLFDGKTFNGWIGDTNKTWKIIDGALVGGSTNITVPRNEFIYTARSFTNFILSLEFKLVGTEGFINGGVQIRSKPLKNPPNEMRGYQCDMGDGYWGSIYDESRRNKTLAKPNDEILNKTLKKNDWNHYLIRCEGKRIRLYLNNVLMVDYTEQDPSIEQYGVIGLQIHGGAKAIASYRNIKIQELP